MNQASELRTSQLAKRVQSLRAYLRTTPWPLLTVAAAFGLIDFICVPVAMGTIGPINSGIFFIICSVGCIAAQFAGVSMWWSWSRSEVLWRTLTIVHLVFLLNSLFLIGVFLPTKVRHYWFNPELHEISLFLAIHVTYGLTAASIPLWIMRKLFGWGILPTVSEENHGFTRQISIRDIMVATVIVAVMAALARQIMTLSFNPLPELLIFSAFAGIVSTITLPLLTYWMLHERMRQTGISWALGFSALIPFVPLLIITSTSSGGGFVPIEAVFMLFVVCYAYCGSVILMLYACRKAGFRLLTAWDRLPSDEIVILAVKEEPVHEREITFVDD